MDLPLGFVLKGKVTGLDIVYELTEDSYNYINSSNATVISSLGGSIVSGESKPKEVKKARRFSLQKVEVDKTMKLIDFKNLRVNKFQTFSFLIKNESGIHTNFNLKCSKYIPGMEKSLKTEMMKKQEDIGINLFC